MTAGLRVGKKSRTMEEFLLALIDIDATTFNLLVTLSLFAAFLVMQATGSYMTAAMYLPGIVAGGLLSHFLFSTYGLAVTEFKTANIVAGLTAGMIPGTLLMVLITWTFARVREAITNARYRRSMST